MVFVRRPLRAAPKPPWAAGTLQLMWSSGRPPAADEEVLADQRPHPVFFLAPAVLAGVALAGAIAIAVEFPSAPAAVAWVLGAMVGLPAVWLAGRLVRWRVRRLVVTSCQVWYRRSLVRRDTVVLPVERICAAWSQQTLGERLVGTGRVLLDVPGEGPIVIGDVRRPRSVASRLSARLAAPARAAGPVAGSGGWGADIVPQAPGAAPVSAARSGAVWAAHARPDPPNRAGAVRFDETLPGDPLRGGPADAAAGGPDGPAPTWPGWSTTIPPTPVVWPPADGLPASLPAESSVAGRLMQLDDLWRRGVVSDEEYAEKKAELLRLL